MSDAYTPIIILSLVGFLVVAALLLAPIYVFLKREEKLGEAWTRQLLEQQQAADEPTPTPSAYQAEREDEA